MEKKIFFDNNENNEIGGALSPKNYFWGLKADGPQGPGPRGPPGALGGLKADGPRARASRPISASRTRGLKADGAHGGAVLCNVNHVFDTTFVGCIKVDIKIRVTYNLSVFDKYNQRVPCKNYWKLDTT